MIFCSPTLARGRMLYTYTRDDYNTRSLWPRSDACKRERERDRSSEAAPEVMRVASLIPSDRSFAPSSYILPLLLMAASSSTMSVVVVVVAAVIYSVGYRYIGSSLYLSLLMMVIDTAISFCALDIDSLRFSAAYILTYILMLMSYRLGIPKDRKKFVCGGQSLCDARAVQSLVYIILLASRLRSRNPRDSFTLRPRPMANLR